MNFVVLCSSFCLTSQTKKTKKTLGKKSRPTRSDFVFSESVGTKPKPFCIKMSFVKPTFGFSSPILVAPKPGAETKQKRENKIMIPQNKNAEIIVRFQETIPSVNLSKPLVRFHGSYIFVYMIKSRKKEKFYRLCQLYVPTRNEIDLPVRKIFFSHCRPWEPVQKVSKTIRSGDEIDKTNILLMLQSCLKITKKQSEFSMKKKEPQNPIFFTLALGLLHLLKTLKKCV